VNNYLYSYIVSQEERLNILEAHTFGHSKKKSIMFMCPTANDFRYSSIALYSTLYSVQTNNTPCSHTSCKVH
jgi:hypothetical protein